MKFLSITALLVIAISPVFSQDDSLLRADMLALNNELADQNQEILSLQQVVLRQLTTIDSLERLINDQSNNLERSIDQILVKDSLAQIKVDYLIQNADQQALQIVSISQTMDRYDRILAEGNDILEKLDQENDLLSESVDSAMSISNRNIETIDATAFDLQSRFEESKLTTESKISTLSSDLGDNKVFLISGLLATLSLLFLMTWVLRKRISSSKSDVESQINNTKKSLEEESIKLDSKLVEVLETQLKIQQAESTSSNSSPQKEDHSLALKVADEIVRMERYITKIDPATKGLKPLMKALGKLHDNLKSKGYSIEVLLNKEYDARMNIDVINFKVDEALQEGRKVITRIVKPQVNFNGVLIQRAQVDVSQN